MLTRVFEVRVWAMHAIENHAWLPVIGKPIKQVIVNYSMEPFWGEERGNPVTYSLGPHFQRVLSASQFLC